MSETLSVRFRLLTANLANGGADGDAFVGLVESVEPDVVAVQEIDPRQADALARVLPFGKLEPARDYKGMGILLRQPGTVRQLALPYRGAFVAELPADGDEPIEVVNTHLAAPHTWPPVARFRLRRDQLRQLLAYLDQTPRTRRVVAGDLNATPAWPAYRRFRERLDDAAIQVSRRRGLRPRRTWAPWSGGPRLLRIDHVLVRGLAATNLRVLPVAGSDHSALVVDLDACREADGSRLSETPTPLARAF